MPQPFDLPGEKVSGRQRETILTSTSESNRRTESRGVRSTFFSQPFVAARRLWSDKRQRGVAVGYLASFLIHAVALGILATIVLHQARQRFDYLTIETADLAEERSPFDGPIEQVSLFAGDSGGTETGDDSNFKSIERLETLLPTAPVVRQEPPPAFGVGDVKIPEPALQFRNDFAGRDLGARGKSLGSQGGNEASERAVKLGLKWLAEHQAKNGSWSFNHGPDAPGQLGECTTGATGLALLSFLGAGYTHKAGKVQNPYRNHVNRGLDYLMERMKRNKEGGDLRGKVVGNEGMYAHGIATLALCEALAMTKEGKLKVAAQQAVDFIINAQDPNGGGWRYNPRDRGDTTVTGWQVMALKSAKAAGLVVPDDIVKKAGKFLDAAAVHGGAQYAYEAGGPPGTPAITAIGLLCRMYLGWTPDVPALGKGVEYLADTGPSPSNIYFNYYATQVLHHWGGEPWGKWNNILRERLVATQISEGESAGSWHPAGDHSAAGGRLYQTCLSIMTLEVYYRYLPMYESRSSTPGKRK